MPSTSVAQKKSRFSSHRIISLIGATIFLLCVWGFLEIADDFPEDRYRRFDEAILRSFRTPADLSVPRGPPWVKGAVRDISALGSAAVLTLTVVGITGYLILLRRWKNAVAIIFACVGGQLLNSALKALVARPRPAIVPHLAEETSNSFPSGHSMLSAIFYLSVGALLAQNAPGKKTACYALSCAILLTLMVGCTRVYLGVHYPSDVIAGWTAGTAWALFCVAVQLWFERRPARSAAAKSEASASGAA